ncbi:MAG: hypothetical protein KAI55_01040 [Candidatus Aenigmarchaeota archaeon]|nr:hypothetical protein [Candidatus Aenigmarchaeota archaeon]
MNKQKHKAMIVIESILMIILIIVFCTAIPLSYLFYVSILSSSTIPTMEYVENTTHSSMLEFSMLNANYINKGTVDSLTQVCAKNTQLPIKSIIGIGLLNNPANPHLSFDVGYKGYESQVDMVSCMSPIFTSLGYSIDIIKEIFVCTALVNPIFLFIPINKIPDVGHAETYVLYNGNTYYKTPGMVADIADNLGWLVCPLNNLKALPIIGDFYGDADKALHNPKTTYAYIVLPNEDVATVVTKTN